MHDKNGKKIYEGDIIKQPYLVNTDFEDRGEGYYEPIDSIEGEFIGVVHYKPSAGFSMHPFVHIDSITNEKEVRKDGYKPIYQTRSEVIGNITDNKEILPINISK